MKKLLTITLTALFFFAQYSDNENTFRNGETTEQKEPNQNDAAKGGPGNPGQPTPINEFIPFLLVLAGVGIYFTSKKYLKSR